MEKCSYNLCNFISKVAYNETNEGWECWTLQLRRASHDHGVFYILLCNRINMGAGISAGICTACRMVILLSGIKRHEVHISCNMYQDVAINYILIFSTADDYLIYF